MQELLEAQAKPNCPGCGSDNTGFLFGMIQVRCRSCMNTFVRPDLDEP